MSEQEQAEPTARPGAFALSVAGITELVVSAVLYGLKVYAASIAFGLAALFVAITANAISAQGRDLLRRQGIEPQPETERGRRRRQTAFITAAMFGTAAVGLAVIQLINERFLPASVFGMWALCCAVFALRFR
jgi:hypothetical protein